MLSFAAASLDIFSALSRSGSHYAAAEIAGGPRRPLIRSSTPANTSRGSVLAGFCHGRSLTLVTSQHKARGVVLGKHGREVLLDLKRRGLKQDPKLAIGDGALGFWTALREAFASTREQRCWGHTTMNVLNAMPKSMQEKAKSYLHDIWQAETKAAANAAFDFFVETYGVKWDKAVPILLKDRDALLTFYDYPAEHWKHIRTSNLIESTFVTSGTARDAPKDASAARLGLPWPSS